MSTKGSFSVKASTPCEEKPQVGIAWRHEKEPGKKNA
jgi:hypothetical protein